MAKPPSDADPEKFVIGHGHYTNLRISRPYYDDHVFRIDPIATPIWSVIILNLAFVAVLYGFHWALKNLTHGDAGPWAVYGIPIGIGLLTCGGVTAAIYWTVANAQRLGPWLIYDKATGRVELPRQGVTFGRQEIVCLQDITTKRLDWGGVMNNERLSELNLITSRDGVRKRWPLLRSTLNQKAFDHILKSLVENTDLPVMQVRDEWLGWRVTETSYKQNRPSSTAEVCHWLC
jgi:hypothetical protein